LTKQTLVTTVLEEGRQTRSRARSGPSMSSRCPGLNRGPTVYEGEFQHSNQVNFQDVSAEGKQKEADPHVSARTFVYEPDQVALGLLETQIGWISTHDPVKLRRALLALVASLDE
jgi:hypothetical protein